MSITIFLAALLLNIQPGHRYVNGLGDEVTIIRQSFPDSQTQFPMEGCILQGPRTGCTHYSRTGQYSTKRSERDLVREI